MLLFKEILQINYLNAKSSFRQSFSASTLASEAHKKEVGKSFHRNSTSNQPDGHETSFLVTAEKSTDRGTNNETVLPYELRLKLNRIAFPLVLPSASVNLSVYGGYKIQAGLVIHRVPLKYEEPRWKSSFRKFRDEWTISTKNHFDLDPSLIFMKLPHHRYVSPDDKIEKIKEAGLVEVKENENPFDLMPELHRLINSEGFDNTIFSQEDTSTESKPDRKLKEKRLLDPEPTNVYRAPWDLLTLLVRYPSVGNNQGKWSLPLTDRCHGDSMEKTLAELCYNQLGTMFSPHIPNLCPISEHRAHFDEQLFKEHGLRGRQVFYYRAYWIPGRENVQIEESSPIERYAWVRSREITNYLGEEDAAMLRNCSLLN